MKYISLLIFSFSILFTLSTSVFSQFAKVFIIEENKKVKVIDTDLLEADKSFTFNWLAQGNANIVRHRIVEVENILKKSDGNSQLNAEEKEARGRLLFKLASYYAHDDKIDLAIAKSNLANAMLRNSKDKTWNYNNLAYAYGKKYQTSAKAADKTHALYYANKVIADNGNARKEEVAFAYCVKGLLGKFDNNHLEAERNYQQAYNISKTLNKPTEYKFAKSKTQPKIPNPSQDFFSDPLQFIMTPTPTEAAAFCDTEVT